MCQRHLMSLVTLTIRKVINLKELPKDYVNNQENPFGLSKNLLLENLLK